VLVQFRDGKIQGICGLDLCVHDDINIKSRKSVESMIAALNPQCVQLSSSGILVVVCQCFYYIRSRFAPIRLMQGPLRRNRCPYSIMLENIYFFGDGSIFTGSMYVSK
jgi:hypothetical protein